MPEECCGTLLESSPRSFSSLLTLRRCVYTTGSAQRSNSPRKPNGSGAYRCRAAGWWSSSTTLGSASGALSSPQASNRRPIPLPGRLGHQSRPTILRHRLGDRFFPHLFELNFERGLHPVLPDVVIQERISGDCKVCEPAPAALGRARKRGSSSRDADAY